MQDSLTTNQTIYNPKHLKKYRETTAALLRGGGIFNPKNYSISSVPSSEATAIFQVSLRGKSLTTQSANHQMAQYLKLIQARYEHVRLSFDGEPSDGAMKLDFSVQYSFDYPPVEEPDELIEPEPTVVVPEVVIPQTEVTTAEKVDEVKTSKEEEIELLAKTQPNAKDGKRFSSAELHKPQRTIKTRELLPLTEAMFNNDIKGKTLREVLSLCKRVAVSEDGRFDVYYAPPEVLKLYFSCFEENRGIMESHVESLEDSYETHGYLYTEAFVNEYLQEIDAQHRVETAIRNDLGIYFRIKVGWGMEEVMVYNINNKNWTALNFLDSYAKKGIPAYVMFKEFYDKHDFDLSTCEILFKGHRLNKGKNASKNDFNNKRLMISEHELEQAEIRASAMADFKEYHPKGWTSRNFAEAVHFLLTSPKYKHAELLRKMSKMKEGDNILFKAKGPLRVEEYVKFLVNTFNKNTDDSELIAIPHRYMQ